MLLFLGRMHPDKGVAQAIEVAERSGSRLVIAARIHGREEEDYFETVVRPRLSSNIEFAGEVGFGDKVRLLGSAKALLFPLQWDEPYGLVVAEAQACGTPVLSLARGAIPELVQHGTTGWVREHHLELVDDVGRLESCQARLPHARTHLDSAARPCAATSRRDGRLGQPPLTRTPPPTASTARRRPAGRHGPQPSTYAAGCLNEENS
jgi:hypothetical protein